MAKNKENKVARFGMRIAPNKKEAWEETARSWGYKSTSDFIESMVDWAIQWDKFDGDYKAYLEGVKK